ncbi:MAG: uroporphyrinogen-III synthase [Gammaproteobacteria bacterium]|jgi:uroporphyrinogen-III synthase|nr:uroporphyrinogen-III synthase [Gammaproteobacteria bacterium]
MTKNLLGLTVLITRPRPQGEQLAKLIQAEGGHSFVWPCLEIVPSPSLKHISDSVRKIDQNGLFVFVSPNAVAYTFSALNQAEKQRLQHSPLIAIGEGTAKALNEQGCLQVAYPERAYSEGLLNLPQLHNVEGKSILIFRGQSGRELIFDSLLEKKAKVEYVEVYHRQKPDTDPQKLIQAWRNKAFDIVIATSSEGLQNLIEMLGEQSALLKKTTLTVMNEKMLHLAKQVESRPLWIDKASNSAILDYLKRFLHERL